MDSFDEHILNIAKALGVGEDEVTDAQKATLREILQSVYDDGHSDGYAEGEADAED